MSIRCKSVCVDGALTLAENLQSNEENEKSLYLLAGFLPLVVSFFLPCKHYIDLNHFFLKALDFTIIKKDTVDSVAHFLKVIIAIN